MSNTAFMTAVSSGRTLTVVPSANAVFIGRSVGDASMPPVELAPSETDVSSAGTLDHMGASLSDVGESEDSRGATEPSSPCAADPWGAWAAWRPCEPSSSLNDSPYATSVSALTCASSLRMVSRRWRTSSSDVAEGAALAPAEAAAAKAAAAIASEGEESWADWVRRRGSERSQRALGVGARMRRPIAGTNRCRRRCVMA